MTPTDLELLERFTREHAEEAFATLVQRHLNLVYSAALRQVRSPELAREVSQSVFTDLVRNASRLKPGTVLAAWLYQVTRRTAVDSVRRESRRQLRERLAAEVAAMNTTTDWSHIEPLLEEAMDALDGPDRAALLLRYFENKSLREVGLALGVTDDAAQKRVSRAVERLRERFSRQEITLGTGAIVAAISAHAVQAAPAGLASAISASAALAGHSAAGLVAAKAIAMTTTQKTLVAAVLAVAVGTGVYEARQASIRRQQVRALQQQVGPLGERLRQLEGERDAATSNLARARGELERLRRELAELPKLRGELARLRDQSPQRPALNAADSDEATQSAALSWTARVTLLKQKLAQTPTAGIPELALLTEDDWLNAARGRLETEVDFRRALSVLRGAAENKFAGALQSALKAFMKANDGQFPTDVAQLGPFFQSAVDPAILQRWEVVSAEKIKSLGLGGDVLISQKAPVDDVFDTCYAVGPVGRGSTDFLSKEVMPALGPVYEAYTKANHGEYPADPSELLSFATTQSQQEAVHKLMVKQASGAK